MKSGGTTRKIPNGGRSARTVRGRIVEETVRRWWRRDRRMRGRLPPSGIQVELFLRAGKITHLAPPRTATFRRGDEGDRIRGLPRRDQATAAKRNRCRFSPARIEGA